MKLQNHLVVTLFDFARHFEFTEFWVKRYHFLRDMAPDKAYYWNDTLFDCYDAISKWILAGDNADMATRSKGLDALESLLAINGQQLDRSQIPNPDGTLEISPDSDNQTFRIIAGQTVILPAFNPLSDLPHFPLQLHKITIIGNNNDGTIIQYGDYRTTIFDPVVYFTASQGKCIDIVNCSANDENTHINPLPSNSFASPLVGSSISPQPYATSVAITNSGFAYIDHRGMVMLHPNDKIRRSFICNNHAKALWIKTSIDSLMVLYNDGVLMTDGFGTQDNIYTARFHNGTVLTNNQ